MPIRSEPVTMLVDEHDAPWQVVEGVKRGVSFDLQLGYAAVHSERALQMRQQGPATFDVIASEAGAAPRPHDVEKHRRRLFPGQHRTQPVM
jgi:hypothetical protein